MSFYRDPEISFGSIFAEARYGQVAAFGGSPEEATGGFAPYAGFRVGYGNVEREISAQLTLSDEALVLTPLAGLHYWLSKDVAFGLAGLANFAFFGGGLNGGFIGVQPSVAIRF